MSLILGLYAGIVWILFFKLKIFPWGTLSKTIVSIVGLAILLTFMALLNSRTPSGRVTVLAPVVEIAPRVSGTVTDVLVVVLAQVSAGAGLIRLDPAPLEHAVQLAQANYDFAQKTYDRKQASFSAIASTDSKQALDEVQSVLTAAEAQLMQARFDLAGAEISARRLAKSPASRCNPAIGSRLFPA